MTYKVHKLFFHSLALSRLEGSSPVLFLLSQVFASGAPDPLNCKLSNYLRNLSDSCEQEELCSSSDKSLCALTGNETLLNEDGIAVRQHTEPPL